MPYFDFDLADLVIAYLVCGQYASFILAKYALHINLVCGAKTGNIVLRHLIFNYLYAFTVKIPTLPSVIRDDYNMSCNYRETICLDSHKQILHHSLSITTYSQY